MIDDAIARAAEAMWNRMKLVGCSKGYHEGASDMLEDADLSVQQEMHEYARAALEASGLLQGKQELVEAPGTIMLNMAEAGREAKMWERRLAALWQMYAIDRRFVDQDGKWGLTDYLDYTAQICGFPSRAALSVEGE